MGARDYFRSIGGTRQRQLREGKITPVDAKEREYIDHIKAKIAAPVTTGSSWRPSDGFSRSLPTPATRRRSRSPARDDLSRSRDESPRRRDSLRSRDRSSRQASRSHTNRYRSRSRDTRAYHRDRSRSRDRSFERSGYPSHGRDGTFRHRTGYRSRDLPRETSRRRERSRSADRGGRYRSRDRRYERSRSPTPLRQFHTRRDLPRSRDTFRRRDDEIRFGESHDLRSKSPSLPLRKPPNLPPRKAPIPSRKPLQPAFKSPRLQSVENTPVKDVVIVGSSATSTGSASISPSGGSPDYDDFEDTREEISLEEAERSIPRFIPPGKSVLFGDVIRGLSEESGKAVPGDVFGEAVHMLIGLEQIELQGAGPRRSLRALTPLHDTAHSATSASHSEDHESGQPKGEISDPPARSPPSPSISSHKGPADEEETPFVQSEEDGDDDHHNYDDNADDLDAEIFGLTGFDDDDFNFTNDDGLGFDTAAQTMLPQTGEQKEAQQLARRQEKQREKEAGIQQAEKDHADYQQQLRSLLAHESSFAAPLIRLADRAQELHENLQEKVALGPDGVTMNDHRLDLLKAAGEQDQWLHLTHGAVKTLAPPVFEFDGWASTDLMMWLTHATRLTLAADLKGTSTIYVADSSSFHLFVIRMSTDADGNPGPASTKDTVRALKERTVKLERLLSNGSGIPPKDRFEEVPFHDIDPSTKTILIPYNVKNMHWVLVIITVDHEKTKGSCEIVDSYEDIDLSKSVCTEMVEFLKLLALHPDLNWGGVEWQQPKKVQCPKQNNAHDCGFFTWLALDLFARTGKTWTGALPQTSQERRDYGLRARFTTLQKVYNEIFDEHLESPDVLKDGSELELEPTTRQQGERNGRDDRTKSRAGAPRPSKTATASDARGTSQTRRKGLGFQVGDNRDQGRSERAEETEHLDAQTDSLVGIAKYPAVTAICDFIQSQGRPVSLSEICDGTSSETIDLREGMSREECISGWLCDYTETFSPDIDIMDEGADASISDSVLWTLREGPGRSMATDMMKFTFEPLSEDSITKDDDLGKAFTLCISCVRISRSRPQWNTYAQLTTRATELHTTYCNYFSSNCIERIAVTEWSDIERAMATGNECWLPYVLEPGSSRKVFLDPTSKDSTTLKIRDILDSLDEMATLAPEDPQTNVLLLCTGWDGITTQNDSWSSLAHRWPNLNFRITMALAEQDLAYTAHFRTNGWSAWAHYDSTLLATLWDDPRTPLDLVALGDTSSEALRIYSHAQFLQALTVVTHFKTDLGRYRQGSVSTDGHVDRTLGFVDSNHGSVVDFRRHRNDFGLGPHSSRIDGCEDCVEDPESRWIRSDSNVGLVCEAHGNDTFGEQEEEAERNVQTTRTGACDREQFIEKVTHAFGAKAAKNLRPKGTCSDSKSLGILRTALPAEGASYEEVIREASRLFGKEVADNDPADLGTEAAALWQEVRLCRNRLQKKAARNEEIMQEVSRLFGKEVAGRLVFRNADLSTEERALKLEVATFRRALRDRGKGREEIVREVTRKFGKETADKMIFKGSKKASYDLDTNAAQNEGVSERRNQASSSRVGRSRPRHLFRQLFESGELSMKEIARRLSVQFGHTVSDDSLRGRLRTLADRATAQAGQLGEKTH
ncbi:hypothetical protein M409DRAFT_56992 [Zasmidium cellare ATCC 36951]|uniref:Ubiquitin-like protease family profile domain-containing protein n=1 Tax=Zasmidium cellare ATCC 36951 TaxID=1080233 RepID=A0A6A6CA11_ZASCE|nr:uncharacterized protein M409DRAFT_56992 [Zasmidium cellare ATCC 36951]KAF2163881.1 hypothetical protein M409DRAFT_56992 [Zasmidium cellare ATCC 36951]